MDRLFHQGDAVRVKGANGEEMIVEGYDAAGQVVCSYWNGVTRDRSSYEESSLEKTPQSGSTN